MKHITVEVKIAKPDKDGAHQVVGCNTVYVTVADDTMGDMIAEAAMTAAKIAAVAARQQELMRI